MGSNALLHTVSVNGKCTLKGIYILYIYTNITVIFVLKFASLSVFKIGKKIS